MTREEIIKQLQEVVDKHRKEAHITCPDTCWCWDVQNIILSIELSLPPAEGAETIKQALCDDIEKSLNGVHLNKIFDSEQNGLPLVDYLSAGSPVNTIGAGKKEIENIVEQIYFDMEDWQSLAALQPQPTAEGAEEYVLFKAKRIDTGDWVTGFFTKKNIGNLICPVIEVYKEWDSGDYMESYEIDDSTLICLHAQKIADKMVEERLREELIKYDKYIGSRGWIDNYEDWAAITSVDEYLKQRQP